MEGCAQKKNERNGVGEEEYASGCGDGEAEAGADVHNIIIMILLSLFFFFYSLLQISIWLLDAQVGFDLSMISSASHQFLAPSPIRTEIKAFIKFVNF